MLLSVLISVLDSFGIGVVVGLLQLITSNGAIDNFDFLQRINQIFTRFGAGGLNFNTLIFLAILLFISKGIITYIQQYILAVINAGTITKIRKELVSDILNMEYEKFIQTDIGTIHNVSTIEAYQVNIAINTLLNIVQYVVISICYIIIAAFVDVKFTLLMLMVSGITLLAYDKINSYFKRLSTQVSKKGNLYSSYLTQFLNHFKYLKSTNAGEQFKNKIYKEIDDVENIKLKIKKISAITLSIREPLIFIIIAVVILIYNQYFGRIENNILFTLLLFYRTANYLLMIQNNRHSYNQYYGSVENLINTKKSLKESRENIEGLTFDGFSQQIQLVNISVEINSTSILNDINMAIPKNSSIAIVGKSGAGKSTLASVICGLVKPKQGDIIIDQRNINIYNIDSFRRKIGYVSQDSVIFNDTIYNNIALWEDRDDSSNERFKRSTKIAQVASMIDHLDNKENALVGDNGIKLSGGQKQRISIARELYKESEIIIFDEATSSLDSITEQIIQDNIVQMKGKLTMIIIAHRLSTIKNADQIVFLENGKIIDSGNYEELLSSSNEFRKMVELQTK